MRERRLIKEGDPCFIDYADKSIQSVSDAIRKGKVLCPNMKKCEDFTSRDKDIHCALKRAQEMAGFVIDSKEAISQAIENEKKDFLELCEQNKHWVCRNGEWLVIMGKENVLNDIADFVRTIIDLKPGERRPFTKDGMRTPEFGPSDAMHNAMLDLDDVYGEIGQKSSFR